MRSSTFTTEHGRKRSRSSLFHHRIHHLPGGRRVSTRPTTTNGAYTCHCPGHSRPQLTGGPEKHAVPCDLAGTPRVRCSRVRRPLAQPAAGLVLPVLLLLAAYRHEALPRAACAHALRRRAAAPLLCAEGSSRKASSLNVPKDEKMKSVTSVLLCVAAAFVLRRKGAVVVCELACTRRRYASVHAGMKCTVAEAEGDDGWQQQQQQLSQPAAVGACVG